MVSFLKLSFCSYNEVVLLIILYLFVENRAHEKLLKYNIIEFHNLWQNNSSVVPGYENMYIFVLTPFTYGFIASFTERWKIITHIDNAITFVFKFYMHKC